MVPTAPVAHAQGAHAGGARTHTRTRARSARLPSLCRRAATLYIQTQHSHVHPPAARAPTARQAPFPTTLFARALNLTPHATSLTPPPHAAPHPLTPHTHPGPFLPPLFVMLPLFPLFRRPPRAAAANEKRDLPPFLSRRGSVLTPLKKQHPLLRRHRRCPNVKQEKRGNQQHKSQRAAAASSRGAAL